MQTEEAQDLNTTEQKVEIYTNDIELYLDQYCIDHGIKNNDLYKIDQSRWNSVLLYIYKHVFKPTPDNMHIPQELRIRSRGTERHSA